MTRPFSNGGDVLISTFVPHLPDLTWSTLSYHPQRDSKYSRTWPVLIVLMIDGANGGIHESRAQEPIECWQFRNFENDTRLYRSSDFQWEEKPPVFLL